jgi:PHD/YefM family antitoxin component YafN of YafNO toxin-antitoxin module
MSEPANLQYVHDAAGNAVSVIVPIDIWREIESERETAHLLSSPAMKARLLAAMQRTNGTSLEDTRAKLGI